MHGKSGQKPEWMWCHYELVLRWIWKSKCVPEFKVFAWLLLKDRLNTFGMMDRRHWNRSDLSSCRLCISDMLEDCDHLFFLAAPLAVPGGTGSAWLGISNLVSYGLHLCGLAYWKQQNDLVSYRGHPSCNRWFTSFKQEAGATSS